MEELLREAARDPTASATRRSALELYQWRGEGDWPGRPTGACVEANAVAVVVRGLFLGGRWPARRARAMCIWGWTVVMRLGAKGGAQCGGVARVVEESLPPNFLELDGGDWLTYYSPGRLGLRAYCAFPNRACSAAGELSDRPRVPDEQAEALWPEFVAGGARGAAADGFGGSGYRCPTFARDQWVAAQEEGARSSARARGSGEGAGPS